jgi:DNA polymerase III delta prime subunit
MSTDGKQVFLTRHGKCVPVNSDLKRQLTVRAVENAMGIRPPAFKVYREGKSGKMYIPRFFGEDTTIDKREEPVSVSIKFQGTLRDSTRQNEAFRAGVEAFRKVGGGVLSLPPGFGKTTMALAYAAHLGVRTMIIVHKEFLANQWKERIQQFCPGATIGRVQQDVFDIEHDFVIGMIQTMCSRENDPKAFDTIGFVIVDEAHHIGAAAFSQTMFKLCPRYSLGLTATPDRKDGLTNILYWFMGPEFFRVQRENQATTRVETVFFDDPAFREAPPVSRFGKINMAGMVTQLTEIPARNQKILSLVKSLDPSRRVLLLSDRREHCFWLRDNIEGAALYLGGMKEDELDVSSRARVIVATYSMAQEGLDIPVLDTLVMTTPHSDVTQAVGRIMRETPGKVNAPLIIDIVDRWSVFNSMFKKRCVVYKTAGFAGLRDLDSGAQEFPKGKCLLSLE